MFIGITQTGQFQLDPFESVVRVIFLTGGSSDQVVDVFMGGV
jgi:hypothetical protein